MPTREQILERLATLVNEGKRLPTTSAPSGSYIPQEPWQTWTTQASHLLRMAFGPDSTHSVRFDKFFESRHAHATTAEGLLGILAAAKDDYEQGFAVGLEQTISGEIFGDFVGLAKTALAAGHKDVAAVLASAALEDALKRFAQRHHIVVDDKSMQDVVNAMKSKSLVSGAQKSLLDTMPKQRDYAMHANWDKLTPESVGAMIGFVETFLLNNF